ncbi:MAG: 2-oxo acid dehydrogenase subunit E2 [Anaerolineales bacterium]|nr:2-oxo acid dehydrogenase subunit E2 [Anaerolineales bacterium]
MANEVIMPQLGESVVEGTVTKWLKSEGDAIEEFEPLLEVNTDKVDTEVPAPASGTVLKLYVAEGQTVRAGTLLAMIGKPGDPLPETPQVKHATEEKAPSPLPEPVTAQPAAPQPGRSQKLGFISPVVARIASEHGVDLMMVPGTGRNGRITKKDVLAYLETRAEAPIEELAPWEKPAFGELFRPTEEIFGPKEETAPVTAPATDAEGEILPLDTVRRAIAEHMLRSKRTSPHVTTIMEVDFGRVVAHRETNREFFAREGINLTYTAYFVSAAVEALKAVPVANSSWSDQGIILHPRVNVGVAVSLGEQGLIVPVIYNAAQMSLRGLAWAVNDLATRARARKLKPDEVQNGTFTITNHGVGGSLFATPIINQPQCAILGVGALQKRVVVVETKMPTGEIVDTIAIRPMIYLSLTFDHRILDGAVADHFLGIIVQRLQNWA